MAKELIPVTTDLYSFKAWEHILNIYYILLYFASQYLW